MNIRIFIKKMREIVVDTPKNFRKGLRKIVTILSPRTIPGALTVFVKAGLGLSMIAVDRLIKFVDPSKEDNLVEQAGYLLAIDSALDVVKIYSMVKYHQYNLYLKRNELQSLNSELEKYTGDKSIKKNNREFVRSIQQKRDLVRSQYFQMQDNSPCNVENYLKILNSTMYFSSFTDAVIFTHGTGIFWLIDDFIENFMDEVYEMMREMHAPNAMGNMVGISIAFCFVLMFYDLLGMLREKRTGIIGSQPWIGGLTASVLLSNFASTAKQYKKFAAHTNKLTFVDDSVIIKLSGYQNMADKIYNREYQSAYNSMQGTYANYETAAGKVAGLKRTMFHYQLKSSLGSRLFLKNLFIATEPLIHLYALTKLAKNGIVALENILDLLDERFDININTTNKNLAVVLTQAPVQAPIHAQVPVPAQLERDPTEPRLSLTNETDSQEAAASLENLEMENRVNRAGTVEFLAESQSNPENESQTQEESANTAQNVGLEDNNASAGPGPVRVKVKRRGTPANQQPPHAPALIFSRENKEKDEKQRRKEEILSGYRNNCHKRDRELFRSILDGTANNVRENEIINLAARLNLEPENTSLGKKILVYKQTGASFHRLHDDVIDPGFFREFSNAFKTINISLDDLNNLDIQISQQAAAARGILRSIHYVLTTNPRLRVGA